MKRLLCLPLLFSASALCAATGDPLSFSSVTGEALPDFAQTALPFRPEWQTRVVERSPEGIPLQILLCTPDHDWPVKRLRYSHSGELIEETDLQPYNGNEQDREVPHGICVEYYETGDIKRVTQMNHGKQSGGDRLYGESGGLLFEAAYADGKPHGVMKTYWPSGKLCSEANYENGLLHGGCYTFYEAGEENQKASL